MAENVEKLINYIYGNKRLLPCNMSRNAFFIDPFCDVIPCNGMVHKAVMGNSITVNISRISLYNPKLADILSGLIKQYDVPIGLLNLEITESAYVSDPELIQEAIRKLHQAGFILMMDDFGSGYSSLNMLKDIDVDVLKIDMQFLSGGESPGKGKIILESVIQMANNLGMPVIMEGVETQEQTRFLYKIGCNYVQGYYYARPMPQEEYEKKYIYRRKGATL